MTIVDSGDGAHVSSTSLSARFASSFRSTACMRVLLVEHLRADDVVSLVGT